MTLKYQFCRRARYIYILNRTAEDSGAQAIVQKNPVFDVVRSNPRRCLKTLGMYRDLSQHTQRADGRDKVNMNEALDENAGDRYRTIQPSQMLEVPTEETR